MGALHRFEQRLETLVTGAFARAFKSAVQPMEIAAALQREVDNSAQILSRDRRLAPNNFTVDLSPSDYERLSTYGQTLAGQLADLLHEHADEQHYFFAGPLELHFQRAPDLTTGRFHVTSRASATVTPAPSVRPPATPPAGMPGSGVPSQPDGRAAGPSQPTLALEVNGTRHRLMAPGLVVGRGSQADLRIDDPGISRRHAEFKVEAGPDHHVAVTVVDLGSTNGTTVDGHRVQRASLRDGAVVQIGATRIILRAQRAS